MQFNHKNFFDGTRLFLQSVGRGLTQERVAGLDYMLSSFEKDAHWTDTRHIAYAFATSCIETDWTFEPIQEYGSYARFEKLYGWNTRKGRELGNDAAGEGAKYSGKGYEQLTGESNYEKAEIELRRQYPRLIAEFETRTGKHFDLTDFPAEAKDRQIAFAIMTLGMFGGWFTGRKFSDYINSHSTDYRNARRIINGVDRAGEIAGYAGKFEKILNDALSSEVSAETISDHLDSISTDTPNGLASSHNPQGKPSNSSVGETAAPVPDPNEAGAADSHDNQIAENINIGTDSKQVPDDFKPDTLTVNAPPPAGIMAKAKVWVASLGVGIPSLAGAADYVKGFFSDDAHSVSAAFGTALTVAKFVFPYVIYLAITFVIAWGLIEMFKQISLIVKIYTNARGDMNNVEIEPIKPVEAYSWMKARLPFRSAPPSVVENK